MPLSPGDRLGPYEILGDLGAGGMGVVYRARDTTLGREVAIKVLPHLFAADPERLARFKREARLLASLNHPHIGAIYGFEDAEGAPALVLELVEGETLAERLQRGRLPATQALTIATQIAQALEAAHERGIVHRDLKPANVKITPDGVVKVLDFGLAKVAAGDGSGPDLTQLPTVTADGTREGTRLGTAAYMSPEQARGQDVDRRTDIWAFGVVLYEMLAGHRPFEGETVSDTMAAVLRGEPDWGRLPGDTPPALRTLLRRLLEKDPKRRLRDVADTFLSDVTITETSGPPPVAAHARVSIGVWAIVVALAIALAASLGWRTASPSLDRSWSGELLGGPPMAAGARLSPDGTTLAFQAWINGLNQVAIMTPESGDWTVLTNDRSRGQILDLSWSPDGTRIYFDRYLGAPLGVFSVPVLGGDARPVAADAMYPKALPDGSLLIVRLNTDRRLQLERFLPDTGRGDPLPAFWRTNVGWPLVAAFPDGKEAAFYGLPGDAEASDGYSINVLDLTTRQTRLLSASVNIVQGAFPGGLAVSSDGTRILADDSSGDLHRVMSIARDGAGDPQTLLTLSAPSAYLASGPDESIYADQIVGRAEVLRFPVSGGTPERIAGISSGFGGGIGVPPSILNLPDGRILLSTRVSGRLRLMVAGADREARPLLETPAESSTPAVVMGDDEVAFMADTAPNQTIAMASLTSGRILRRLEGTRGASIEGMAVSSDRQTIFYGSRGTIWAIPANDGPPRKVHEGDAVAVDPRTDDLIVQQFDAKGARLIRVAPDGGRAQAVPFEGDVFLALFPMSGTAVGRDGRILVEITGRDFWSFRPGLVDPKTGRLEPIPLDYTGDVLSPAWSQKGDVIAAGSSIASSMWRFRRESR
jgi:hypothetical protein